MSEKAIDAAEAQHMPGGPFSKASQAEAAAREETPDPVLVAVMEHRVAKVVADIGQQPGPLLLDMIEAETREWLKVIASVDPIRARVQEAIAACREIEADRHDDAYAVGAPERSIGAQEAISTAESLRLILESSDLGQALKDFNDAHDPANGRGWQDPAPQFKPRCARCQKIVEDADRDLRYQHCIDCLAIPGVLADAAGAKPMGDL